MHRDHNHGSNTEKKHNQGPHSHSSELGRLDNYKMKQ